MRVPRAELAYIEPAKLRDYLLSGSHPLGRFKAAFFRGLGYEEGAWQSLLGDLQALVQQGDAEDLGESMYGRKYSVRGILVGPNGKEAEVVSVWIVLHEDERPRFVTAYPGADK